MLKATLPGRGYWFGDPCYLPGHPTLQELTGEPEGAPKGRSERLKDTPRLAGRRQLIRRKPVLRAGSARTPTSPSRKRRRTS